MSKKPKKPLESRPPICIRTTEARGKVSQEEIAGRLGITPGAYNKYETRSPLRQDLIAPFCRITEVSEKWLLTGEGPMTASKDEETARLWQKYQEADENVKKAVELMLGIKE